MDLNKMSVTELKALWFDQLMQIEQCQLNIKSIGQAIKEKSTVTVSASAPTSSEVIFKDPQ